MKMKSFNGVTRRRGTTIAAAALSVALVAPFVHPVVAPQNAAVAQAQDTADASVPGSSGNNPIDADAIASGDVTSGSGLKKVNGAPVYNGHVYLLAGQNSQTSENDGKAHVPDGTTVLFQWIDDDGAVSPVYSAKTHFLEYGGDGTTSGPGTFVFAPGSWTDKNGKEHTYRMNAKARIWLAEGQTGRAGQPLQQVYQWPGRFPGFYGPVGNEPNGAFGLAGQYMARTALDVVEAPAPYMTADPSEWKIDTDGYDVAPDSREDPNQFYIEGRVWLESEQERGHIGLPTSAGERFVEGYKVVSTILTDEGLQAVKQFDGERPDVRADKIRQLFENDANREKFIAQTVVNETNKDGYYRAHFDTENEEALKYAYQFVQDPEGNWKPTYGAHGANLFQPLNQKTSGAVKNPLGRPGWYNSHLPVAVRFVDQIKVVKFDGQDATGVAAPGQKADIDVTRVFDETNPVRVVWRDERGRELKACDGLTDTASAEACSLDIPKDIKKPQTIRVELEVDGNVTASDSFVVSSAPSITTGSETDEVPADGSEKTLDDKVKNPTEGMTGEVQDKDGNPIDGAKVEIDPKTGDVKVTVPKGTKPQDAKVVVKDKDGKPVGDPIDVKITEPKGETPAPSITTGSETDEVPADGSEKTLDDKVKNPTEGMTGEVQDKDGNPIDGAKVEIDPKTGDVKVTVPKGTKPQDAKVVVKDKDGKPVGDPIDVKITEPKGETPAPSITTGSETDEVPADGSEKTLDDKVKNPTEGMTGEVLDESGDPIDGAKVEVDPETGDIKVTVPEGTDPQDAKVVVKDKDGKPVGDPIDVKITEPKGETPAPSITTGSETDEVPADGSEKTLDDKVKNPTEDMTGEVQDKDGNPIDGAKVEIDPKTGDVKVTVPKGTDPQDAKVVVKDKDGKPVGDPIDVKITEPKGETPAPSITTGSETDEVPADGSEKTLDDKVKNPTEGMTGEVQDKDGNPIDGAKVEIDPKTGDVKVTVPEGTDPQDAKVVVKDKDGKPVGDPIDVKITEPKGETPAPSITTGSETDEVPADGSEKTLDDKVKNPTEGMTGEVQDKDGNPIDGAKVEIDPKTGDVKVTVPKGTDPQDAKVVVKDKDGKPVGDPIDVKITEPKGETPAPSITTGSETDEVPADGSEKTLDDKVKNPTEGMTGEVQDKDGNPIDGAKVEIDPKTGDVKVTVPKGTKPQDAKVVVKDKDGKPVGDPIDVKITEPKTDAPDTSNASVVPDTVTVVEGQEAKPFEVAKDIPEGGQVKAEGLPAGLTVNPSTGEVTGTPAKISDWGKDEEERDVEVTVSVTDKDGKEVAQDTKTVTVQRDTDGDGQPDVTDTDDDNDGATDAEEEKAGTDPKDDSSKPALTDEPSVVTDKVTVVDGQEADPFEVAKNIPEGGKVAAEGLPDGLSVDESTGEVTGTPSVSDWGKDEEERDVEVTVSVTDSDGKEVAQDTKTVTVQRDTDGDGQPDVTDTDDDNDGATDAEETEAGTDPKDANSKPEAKPGDDQGATSVDKSGVKDVKPSGEDQNTGIKVTNPDEGTKVSATDKNGKDVPAKIDDNGNVVVTPGEDVEGPITVVIEDEDLDGGKAEVEVGVKGEEPDNQGGSSDLTGGSSLPDLSSGSSNVDWKRCAPAAAGVGIPLLFLLPIGLASQMNIPGFSPLVKQVSAQIDGINRQLGAQNTALQKQLGIYNGPLAQQANQINLMLKKVSPEAGRIGGGIALAAAGALALGLVANACSPNGGSSSSSSSSK